ncbi:lysophospholipase catalytic domain-containing protein [Phakopsora pachyrhizi]|uniref:Lysophospholipase n=1 Tax=Phakopsora pachyrhizi TaxID=170000 RepID=A0AAV0ASF7_PHAPC|nr:lysophospholipase catalytic domain-containing protein [Phakopsora pachyrhizi]CAH7670781.1 lysophospholipase catalytic domain-domain-containing protein [Phakopsora pachyrhizi]
MKASSWKFESIFCFLISQSYLSVHCRWHHRRDHAIEGSPSGGYAPVFVKCPPNFSVRIAAVPSAYMSEGEKKYISQRSAQSLPLWKSYLSRANLTNFDVDQFLNVQPVAGETVPNIALAVSGGGIRALLGGAGTLSALDDRNSAAVDAGTGGILQLANYITGLSGSSWLIGSWATSNFPTFTELNQTVWDLTVPAGVTSWDSIKEYPKAVKRAKKKHRAGFPSSLVDVESYIISKHLINDTHHGTSVLFSTIKNTTGYRNRTAPFPILLSTSRYKGVSNIDYDTPIYEFNPEEFGVTHPTLKAFIPMEYLGTHLVAGKPTGEHTCVNGFDNAGFVITASSNVLSQPGATNVDFFSLKSLIKTTYDKLTKHILDEAIIPNPFYLLGLGLGRSSGYPDQTEPELYLADGGWGGEVVPFWPLLQAERKIDTIIAIDYESDSDSMFKGGYTEGMGLYRTYLKSQRLDYENISFPKLIPEPKNFSKNGLNKKPSFFGCYEPKTPLIVYLPNYYVVANTRMATLKTEYTAKEINGFFRNSFAITAQTKSEYMVDDNLSDDLRLLFDRAGPIGQFKWKTCLACAMISRQLYRNNIDFTSQCKQCFDYYCA